MNMIKKVLAVVMCIALFASISAVSVFAEDAKTEVAGARWFPCEPGRENDQLWEVQCLDEGCGCQQFDADPEVTGNNNFLNTVYGEDGSLTLTRTGADDNKEYSWPRIRTLWLETYPTMDLTTANTLYFDLEAVDCQWNLCIGMNGSIVKLAKAITAACGGAALESTDHDAVAGSYKGSINLTDVLADIIATENGTESWVGAKSITAMGANAQVPQIQIFYVGMVDPAATLKINSLYISTPEDIEGANCEYMDMGTIYGDEFYELGDEEEADADADVDADADADADADVDADADTEETAADKDDKKDDKEGGFPVVPVVIGGVVLVAAVVVVLVILKKKKAA